MQWIAFSLPLAECTFLILLVHYLSLGQLTIKKILDYYGARRGLSHTWGLDLGKGQNMQDFVYHVKDFGGSSYKHSGKLL